MAVLPVPGRGDDFIGSLTSMGTAALSTYRNSSENGWCRLVTTELGYGLLAGAALVETAFRAAITLVLATLFVVTIPFAGLWLNNWSEDVVDVDKNVMLWLPLVAGYTTLIEGNEVHVNLVALVQNVRKGEQKLRGEDCTFAELCCGSAPAKKQVDKADVKAEVKEELPTPKPEAETVSV